MNTDYSKKLLDPRWQKKRLEILSRDEFTCRMCGDKENTLHIHHLKYSGNPWEVDDEYLLTYCKDCHDIVESYKKSDRKVLQIFTIPVGDGSIVREVYTVSKELVHDVSIFQFDTQKKLTSAICLDEESLMVYYNKIQELKN